MTYSVVNNSEAWSLDSVYNKRSTLDARPMYSILALTKWGKKPFIIHIQWLLRGDNHNF